MVYYDEEKVIAIITDFDKTLTKAFTPEYLIEHFGHDTDQFWEESNEEYERRKKILCSEESFPEHLRAIETQQRADACYEITYADMILDHIKKGCPRDPNAKKWEGVNRQLLREIGSEIEFFPGLPDAILEEKQFVANNPEWKKRNIKLEWHVISLGLADMIRGSAIGKHLDGIFAYEFVPAPGDNPATGIIDTIATPMLYANKTQYLYQLNKGPLIDVNEKMDHRIRRIPFSHMQYYGDGQSDVPAFAVIKCDDSAPLDVVNKFLMSARKIDLETRTISWDFDSLAQLSKKLANKKGGMNVAVYVPGNKKSRMEAVKLYSEGRVHELAIGDYSPGSRLRQILRNKVTKDAESIISGNAVSEEPPFINL